MEKTRKKIHYAWWVLLGLSIMVGLGKGAVNNSAGLFLPGVSSDLGIGMGQLTLYLSISSVATMIMLPIGGKMMAKYDTKYLLTAAIILQAGAFAGFGLMTSVWGWYILAIPLAVGGVIITVIAGPVLINSWFKKSKGLALGVMGASVGVIGAIVQPIVANLIATRGWSTSYIIVGLAVIILVVPIIFLLIRKSPEEKGLIPYDTEKRKNTSDENKIDDSKHGITLKDAKKSIPFYMLLLFFFFITSIASFTIHIPTFLKNKGYSVEFAGNLMAFYMLGVLLGALLLGYLSDKIGTKTTSILGMALGIVSVLILLFFTDFPLLLNIAGILFGFMGAAIGTLAPMLTTTLFGNKEYSQIYATASMGLAVAGIIALPAYGFMYDAFGSYTISLYAILIMLFLNIVAILVAFKSKQQLVDKGLWN